MSPAPACVVCARPAEPRDRWFDHLWRCRECRLVFADLEAYPDTAALYAESYFKGDEYADYAADRDVLQRNFRRHVELVAGYRPSGRLFEIGCAYGFFLDLARRRWDVAGIDASPAAARHAREVLGLDVRAGDFLASPPADGSVDVVCLWDTIEHLRRPDLYVQQAARSLRPGGILCLTTGDVLSLNARLRGRRWRLIHPPTHLYYFSRPSLDRLFRRFGLSLVHLSYFGYHRRIGSMLHQIARRARPGLLRAALERLGDSALGRRDAYLNLLDIRLAVARKTGP